MNNYLLSLITFNKKVQNRLKVLPVLANLHLSNFLLNYSVFLHNTENTRKFQKTQKKFRVIHYHHQIGTFFLNN